MNLYIVIAELDNDRKEFHGVFSTEEKASEQVKKVNKEYGSKVCYWEETELDKPQVNKRKVIETKTKNKDVDKNGKSIQKF